MTTAPTAPPETKTEFRVRLDRYLQKFGFCSRCSHGTRSSGDTQWCVGGSSGELWNIEIKGLNQKGLTVLVKVPWAGDYNNPASEVSGRILLLPENENETGYNEEKVFLTIVSMMTVAQPKWVGRYVPESVAKIWENLPTSLRGYKDPTKIDLSQVFISKTLPIRPYSRVFLKFRTAKYKWELDRVHFLDQIKDEISIQPVTIDGNGVSPDKSGKPNKTWLVKSYGNLYVLRPDGFWHAKDVGGKVVLVEGDTVLTERDLRRASEAWDLLKDRNGSQPGEEG